MTMRCSGTCSQSMGDGAGLPDIKGQHMMVCVKRIQISVSSRVAPQVYLRILSQQFCYCWDFFITVSAVVTVINHDPLL